MRPSLTSYRSEIESELARIRDAGHYRTLKVVESPQGGLVRTREGVKLNFCSNDYLGLANHPRIRSAAISALDQYGLGSGASQLVCGRSRAHASLEERLCEFSRRDRAILFSTGYQANLSVTPVLSGGRDGDIFEDRLNHASLIDGAILSRSRLHRYKHKDVSSLEEMLSMSAHKTKLVLTDTVFSMDGDIAPLNDIAAISNKLGALLCVDDAHALGVLGDGGRGALEEYKLSQDTVPIMVGTFGKALGCFGAFAAGPDPIIEMLIQKARPFIYTTALPASICAAAEAALDLLQEEAWRREELFDRIKYLRDCAQAISLPLGASTTPIQPLIVGSAKDACTLSDRLYDDGILVTAIRPPTVPRGTSRLRITLSASHSRGQIDSLIAALLRQRKFWQS